MKNYKLIAITSVLLMSILLSGCNADVSADIQDSLKPVIVQEVLTENYTKNMEISGNVKPAQLVNVGFKVAGVIDQVHVKEGDIVGVGQTLMRLDSYDYQLGVIAAQSQYESLDMQLDSKITSAINQAEAHLDFVKTQYERVNRLYEKGAVAKKTVEELETALVVAENKYQEALDARATSEAQLRQAKAGLDLAESQLADTVLTSPIHGTVVKQVFESGETIAPGYPALVLGRLDKLEIEIGVPDTLIDSIRTGEKVNVFIYGLDKEIEGVITSINTIADLQTRTFGVNIEINNKDQRIRPGMIAKVILTADEVESILVPTTAVLNDPDGSKIFVLHEGGYVEERSIVVGEIFGDNIQVLEGLEDGDNIVVEGQYRLVNGDQVKVGVVE
ncbi:MAG: efflux RND transporter periplasmic adaptor subunit [Clostridiaceae bacterium]|nr:efflux RND transporter periplasmic adaptor subunit [Clostridiaceae bacterium]